MEEVKQLENASSGDLIEYKCKIYRVIDYYYTNSLTPNGEIAEVYRVIPAHPLFPFTFIRKIKLIRVEERTI